jgi:hypothetical protein
LGLSRFWRDEKEQAIFLPQISQIFTDFLLKSAQIREIRGYGFDFPLITVEP